MATCKNNKINLTEFGLPEFFSFAQPKLTSNIKLNSQEKLTKKEIKILKNNNKKDKRIKNQLNNNNCKNKNKIQIILENDNNNNISFSKSMVENTEKDNFIDENNNNDNNNNNNMETTSFSIEKEVNEFEEIIKDENNNIDDNEIENNNNGNLEENNFNKEFKILNVDEIIMDEEFMGDENEENYEIHVLGENIEIELLNKKWWLIKRSSNKNKKEKINTDRYVCFIEQNKTARKEHPIHKKHKSTSPNYIPYTRKTSETSSRYEFELNRALKLSEVEYEKQMNANSMPLTQAQINDLLNRELTPEDFALLLLLDEQIKPKTISTREIDDLPTIIYTKEYHDFPACMICLYEFEENENLTKLPCSHIFHINCIANWLSNSSTKCPVDNVEINHHH